MSLARVVQRNGLVFRRFLVSSVVFSFLNPMLFIAAVGFGIGALVSRQNPRAFGGVSYLEFFATGSLVSTAMQTATFETSWPILGKFIWTRTYEAMVATPMMAAQIFLGEMAWVLLRLTMVTVPFFAVLAVFGVVQSPQALLAIPAAILTGLAFASAIAAYSATLRNDNTFNGLFRFVITPLFLFSGTFFPLDGLPAWVRGVANATPLYHGIQLVRGVTLFGIGGAEALWHVAYLVTMFAIGTSFGIRNYTKRLIP